MKKLYYAYVDKNLSDYFEEKIRERYDKIDVLHTNSAISENGELLVYYILKAEEGVIDSKWELK